MIDRRLAVLGFLLLLSKIASSASAATEISRIRVDAYLENPLEKYSAADSTAWQDRMYRLLKANRDPDATARKLAQDDELTVEVEKTLISLWLARSELSDTRWRGQTTAAVYEAQRQALARQALDAVRKSHLDPRVVAVAAHVITFDEQCGTEPFEAIVATAPNILTTGFTAAVNTDCASWWLALHAHAPENTAILARLSAESDELTLPERLAILNGLHERPPATPDARVSLAQDYVSALWQAGLFAEGLRVIDSLRESDRRWLLDDKVLPATVRIDGLPIDTKHGERGQPFGKRDSDFRLEYIAALYLVDRMQEARQVFEALPYTGKLRALLDCLAFAGSDRRDKIPARCKAFGASSAVGSWWLLDSTLNRSDEDPYPLAEAGLSGMSDHVFDLRGSALWTELMRRRLAGPNYAAVRRELAETWNPLSQYSRSATLPTVIARSMNEDFRRKAAAYEQKIADVRVAWGVLRPKSLESARRDVQTPTLPSGFRELMLPDKLRTTRGKDDEAAGEWPKDIARLPDGFNPVRIERDADFTIAVSVSQNLDPTGEVSQGGYWIHLSHDGGRSWSDPLYTGLAEYFPYVVVPQSKMPLWSGDRITMEVEIKEIDPASITYPPVGLQTRRDATNLYLEIPLAALHADQDRDGLTDIMEGRVLLNPADPDTDHDGLEDGRDPMPNVAISTKRHDTDEALEQILERLFGRPMGAIIEPVDRSVGTGIENLLKGKRAEATSRIRPILVRGSAEDFSAFQPDVMMLVYSDADVQKLCARSPDFHTMSLGPVVLNRAGDRGYVVWDLGWTGGTMRLTRDNGAWKLEEVSNWIT